jgi:hypothetical protein
MIYHILDQKQPYKELGADYLEQRRADAQARKQLMMIRQLEIEGYVISKQA